jgi:hypothetical protein
MNYLTDNYDYKVNETRLLGRINPSWRYSNMFYFHTVFENFVSLQTLAVQLKHQKFNGKSLWDMFDNDGNYIGGVRGKVVEQDGTLSDLTDLRAEEISKFKRVHELIHGSYRQEEKVAAEAYAFGQWILQFKRYLPGIIKSFFRSEMRDDSLGRWQKTEEFEPQFNEKGELIQNEGMNVYEWEEAIHEGRHRLVFNMLRGSLGQIGGWNKSKDQNDLDPNKVKGFDYTDYKWSEVMKNPRKQQDLIWYISTAMGMATALALYGAMVPDDEENTYWAWR